jgi:hypothetical protein
LHVSSIGGEVTLGASVHGLTDDSPEAIEVDRAPAM